MKYVFNDQWPVKSSYIRDAEGLFSIIFFKLFHFAIVFLLEACLGDSRLWYTDGFVYFRLYNVAFIYVV